MKMTIELISEAERKELKALLVEKFPDVPMQVTFDKHDGGETVKVRVHILQDTPLTDYTWRYYQDEQYMGITQVVREWHASCGFSDRVKYYVTYTGKEAEKTLSLAGILKLIEKYNAENGFAISVPVIARFGYTKRSTKSFGIITDGGKVMTVIEVDGNAAFCKTVSLVLSEGNDIKAALLDERVPRYGTIVYPLQ
jgi:metal-responsive CopG/Arc/MetJ family transcriptional regulator